MEDYIALFCNVAVQLLMNCIILMFYSDLPIYSYVRISILYRVLVWRPDPMHPRDYCWLVLGTKLILYPACLNCSALNTNNY